MYIIVVNPAIISNTGMPFNGVLTATVLVTAVSTVLMGLYARSPILIAPGMGLNAFFTYTVVLDMHVPWQTALGAVFWAGIFFLVLSVFKIRTYIVQAIPKQLRFGVSAGIGLFISFIGLVNAKFIIANPATLVGFGHLNAVTLTFIAGFFITSLLVIKKIKGALIGGIFFTTMLAIPIGRFYGDAAPINRGIHTLVNWNGVFSPPDFSLLFSLDLVNSLQLALLPVIFAIVFTDLFDSLSTFMGVAEAAGLLDENGEPKNINQSLVVDAFATTISGLAGTSSATAYIESVTGIEEGGRTGLTAIVAGLLFLPFMFLSPLLSVIPSIATAPALVLVGIFMIKPVLSINWDKYDDAIPAFMAMILIPLTYSITQGIIWGFISWTVLKLALGKKEELSPMLLLISAFSVLALVWH
jgi:AGZA family xanthine/uracil permease-like MFS transporter